MKVLFIARSTLYEVFGGDTVQLLGTAKYLRMAGVEVDILLANEKINYEQYDLIHVFNIIRPADSINHIKKSKKPFVVSTIYVDFNEYERRHRKGIANLAAKVFSADGLEYIKVLLRWLKNGERIKSPQYLWWGHRKSIRYLAKNAAVLLPNSLSEMQRFIKDYQVAAPYHVVYNGIDQAFFPQDFKEEERDPKLVLCVARIEGKKNQLQLIKALNNTSFQVLIIGKFAPNHVGYYEECRRVAAPNIHFEGFIPLEQLHQYYRKAKVHVLPSWNETCGLSSLEAAYNGCNIVITDKGDTREYYKDDAWYCDPCDEHSIQQAVMAAAAAPANPRFMKEIEERYNWKNAATETLEVYRQILFTKNDRRHD